MKKFFTKLKILLKRPIAIIIVGKGKETAKEAISQSLKPYFKTGKKVLIFETNLKKDEKFFQFLIKKSSLPILLVTHFSDPHPDKDFFASEKKQTNKVRKLAKLLPFWGYLILNFDDETVREIKDETNLKELTFGFQEGADFRATEIKLNLGTTFKVCYQGNLVPVWLDKLFGKEQIYSALAATSVGVVLGLNLVEISQALKNYHSLPGRMRLIKGIKNSWILDDAESASVFSMIEALEILGKIQSAQRKIAVLGDIVGIGKYTIEAHEAIGEKVAEFCDLLFTFGERAKFIAQGAALKGMEAEKIFQFENFEKGTEKLKKEIKEGDLILVDGSRELEMERVVKALEDVDKS